MVVSWKHDSGTTSKKWEQRASLCSLVGALKECQQDKMLTPHVVACQTHQTFRGAGPVASLTLTLIMKLVLSMVVRFKHIVLLPSRKAHSVCAPPAKCWRHPRCGHKATVPFTSLTMPCANRTLNSGCRKKSHFTRNSYRFFSPELPGSVRA